MALKRILLGSEAHTYEVQMSDSLISIKWKDKWHHFDKEFLEGQIFDDLGKTQVFTERNSLLFKEIGFSENTALIANESAAPMPGKILEVLKRAGDEVKVGDIIIKMEAMKMEHSIKAYKDGSLKEIMVEKDEQVQVGQALFDIE